MILYAMLDLRHHGFELPEAIRLPVLADFALQTHEISQFTFIGIDR